MGGRGGASGLGGRYSNRSIERRLHKIISKTGNDGSYNHEVKLSDWENYGKKRTYIKVTETRTGSKHRATYDFGYVDRKTNTYHPGRHDMEKNYNLSGARFK